MIGEANSLALKICYIRVSVFYYKPGMKYLLSYQYADQTTFPCPASAPAGVFGKLDKCLVIEGGILFHSLLHVFYHKAIPQV